MIFDVDDIYEIEEDYKTKLEEKDKEIERLNNEYLEMKDNFRTANDEIERLDKKIEELNDKIEDDKMIIEGNWGCIDNLRKDYDLQRNIINKAIKILKDTNVDIDSVRLCENIDYAVFILNGEDKE